MNINKETDLILALQAARTALMEERQALLARVTAIDEALGTAPTKAPTKASKGVRVHKSTNIREDVLLALTGSPLTIKQIQEAVAGASPNSVQSVVYGLVSAGTITKDQSTPKKFSLVQAPAPEVKAKTNGAKPNGAVV